MARAQLSVFAVVIICAAMAAPRTSGAQTRADSSRPRTGGHARVALTHALPRLNGGRLKVSVIEVRYGPGESSAPHSHTCPVIGYVAQGSIRTQVKGEPEAIYKTGESFFEAPNGIHLVSANASATSPAILIAYFVCDHDRPLSSAVPK
jgi:quercetin dioxygenase-like cupin family protein